MKVAEAAAAAAVAAAAVLMILSRHSLALGGGRSVSLREKCLLDSSSSSSRGTVVLSCMVRLGCLVLQQGLAVVALASVPQPILRTLVALQKQ